ncbi:MAG: purine-nucleoside phosphorylase [Oscillospiraceae bacterium]
MNTYNYYKESADHLLKLTGARPEIGIILGSGLGHFANEIEDPVTVDYKDIPNFLTSTAVGHAGKMIFGKVSGKSVVCMSGRFHYYEGYDFEQLSIPVRVLKLLGIRALILTNAAGAVNTGYKAGDIMIISDHIKLMGASPMRGQNIEEFGPRFFDMTKTYSPELRKIARDCAQRTALTVHEGVYFFTPGPQYETPAEVRAIRLLGGDAVGMSTVTEALTASHCSLPLLALSVMTNMAAGVLEQPLTMDEVIETANSIEEPFTLYVKDIISRI